MKQFEIFIGSGDRIMHSKFCKRFSRLLCSTNISSCSNAILGIADIQLKLKTRKKKQGRIWLTTNISHKLCYIIHRQRHHDRNSLWKSSRYDVFNVAGQTFSVHRPYAHCFCSAWFISVVLIFPTWFELCITFLEGERNYI